MKKLFLTFSLNFILLSVAYSQAYHPLTKENVYWDVLQGNGQNLYVYDGGFRFFFEGDTTINSLSYKILKYHPFANVPNPYPNFFVDTSTAYIQSFIREDTASKEIYIIEPFSGNQEELFFDCTLNVGDTLFSLFATGGGSLYVIDSIVDITLLNGEIRKAWYFGGYHFFIEGIGTSQGFFFAPFTGLGWWYEDNCVNDNGIHLFGNQCFTILDIERISPQNSTTKIYPNPSTNHVFIERENEKEEILKIFDAKGQVLCTKSLFSKLEKIDLSNLHSGLYLYSIENKETGKIIIK